MVITYKSSFSSEDVNPVTSMLAILPVHLLAMGCTLYSLYFCARALKSAERQRRARFGDFAGTFFLFWIFPIGIWILQPKINRLATGSESRGW